MVGCPLASWGFLWIPKVQPGAQLPIGSLLIPESEFSLGVVGSHILHIACNSSNSGWQMAANCPCKPQTTCVLERFSWNTATLILSVSQMAYFHTRKLQYRSSGLQGQKYLLPDTSHKRARLCPLCKGQAFYVVFLGSSQETQLVLTEWMNDSKTQYLAGSCTIPVLVFICVWRWMCCITIWWSVLAFLFLISSVIIFYVILWLYQIISLALKYVVSKAAMVLTFLERRVLGERQTSTLCQVYPISCSKTTSSMYCWAPVPGRQAPSGRSGKRLFASSRQEDRKFRSSLVNSWFSRQCI